MKIFLSFLFSCIAYSILNHYALDVSYPGLDVVQTSLRSFAIYSMMFSIYSAIPIFISLLIAKLPKQNRNKPYYAYFKNALIVTWVFALAGAYFGWYAHQAVS